MLISNVRSMGMQETLRSLGAVLDAHRARRVCILEVSAGLLVRAAVAESLDDRIHGAWQPLERLYEASVLVEQHLAAVARRGSGYRAGPIERSLRVIGGQVDERGMTRLTLIQHHTDDGWMVWHDGPQGRQSHLLAMSSTELWTLDARIRSRFRRDKSMVMSEI
jgi:hypothetical protein